VVSRVRLWPPALDLLTHLSEDHLSPWAPLLDELPATLRERVEEILGQAF
jgi:hypothetical protein